MKILIIEDETDLAMSICQYLSEHDFLCEWVNTKALALDKVGIYEYDCILLDLMLPDGDGFEILKEIRSQDKLEGVIIISAKDTLETRIEGLQMGADDFLIKPFHISELMVRIQALIRRRKFSGSNRLVFNEIEVDYIEKLIFVHQKPVEFTKKETDLLFYLISNKNRVLSKNAIAEHLSGDMADMLDNHDFVYAHIKNLKKKLLQAGAGDYIKSVYGLGYKWEYES